jgi:glycerophosphoryl diester phosphodiesterase
MLAPRHGYLENTLLSIKAALEYGADVVEIDIHPTSDGEFAVFHDWTLDCRTNGTGVTRAQTMTYLKTLDLGHGYTADGGQTFPFRGKFVGAMPTLAEVAQEFPKTRFLVNVKGSRAEEADKISNYLSNRNVDVKRLMFYGGDAPISRLRTLLPHVRTMTKRSLKDCLTRYVALGWLGHLPSTCRNTVVFVPINYRRLLWGWPNLFEARLTKANSGSFLIGPLNSKTETAGSTAIDDPRLLMPFISGYAGGVSTDRIDIIGPALGRSKRQPSFRRGDE